MDHLAIHLASTTPELIRSWLVLFDPLIRCLLAALTGVVVDTVRRYVKNQNVAKMLLLLNDQAADAVKETYQIFVKDAKDPRIPDKAWDSIAMAQAKAMAVARLKALAPSALAALEAAGYDPDTTAAQKVEAAVLELNMRLERLRQVSQATSQIRPKRSHRRKPGGAVSA